MPENLDLAELKRLDDERRRTNDSDSPDAGEADYQYELYLREHTADIIAMGAELERLHAAHQALSIVNNTEARYEARNKLRRFLQGHIPAILAMGRECERLREELGKSGQLGVLLQEAKDAFNEDRHHLGRRIEILETQLAAVTAECERLRGQRDALAARQARIQAIAEEPDTLLVNPAAEYVWLHDDSQSRKRMTKIRTLLCDLDFAASAADDPRDAEIARLSAALSRIRSTTRQFVDARYKSDLKHAIKSIAEVAAQALAEPGEKP